MVIGFILMLLWVFLTHYIACGLLWPISFSLGILSPFAFLGHYRSICFPWVSSTHFLILHYHRLLLTLLGFPCPIVISFILGAHGLSIDLLLSYFITSGLLWSILTFLYHIMPMGLLLLALGSFRPICFPLRLFIYFIGL